MFDYTNCLLAPLDFTEIDKNTKWKFTPSSNNCTIRFNVADDIPATVFMFIRLTNFFQNHRLYVKSLDYYQLKGDIVNVGNLASASSGANCAWLTYANCDSASKIAWSSGNGMSFAENNPDCFPLADNRSLVIKNAKSDAQYYPCGLIANSMFTDEISDLRCVSGSCSGNYIFSTSNIAWPDDASLYSTTGWATDPSRNSTIPTMLIPPPAWRTAWPDKYGNGYNSSNLPNLKTWERFQVWMRKAGLPTFRKTWGRNDTNTLLKGIYEVNITYNYDVLRFNGTKSLVFSNVGALGVKNLFIPVAFLVVACVSISAAIIIYFIKDRKMGDHSYLSWEKKVK